MGAELARPSFYVEWDKRRLPFGARFDHIKWPKKNTKLRGIEVTRRGAPMPLLLYSGSEDRPWAL